MPAKYIIRFDDICPTMNWDVWSKIENILLKNKIKPIVAIVPDNIDPKLSITNSNPIFWDRVIYWKRIGWTIGMHGYRHDLSGNNSGFIGLVNKTEFAGFSYDHQLEKLKNGYDIMCSNGVIPDIFVAPAHTFDTNTLKALKTLNINYVSDGFSFFPYVDRHDVTWIPQQLWRFRNFRFGIWTICYHHNLWDNKQLISFETYLNKYINQITSVDEVLLDFFPRKFSFVDFSFSKFFFFSLKLRKFLRSSL